MTAAFTIRLDEATLTKLDDLAQRLDRSRNWLVNQALQGYLEHEAWVVARIEEGLRAAEDGKFATDEEVARVFTKYDAAL
jgi:predicted transcriptional regulator